MAALARKRPLVWSLVTLAIAFLLVLAAIPVAGEWLVVNDDLQPAQAVVVFGGQVPFRAMEAASIYKQGWAREVWLTRPGVHDEDLALARLGINRPLEHEISRQVLLRSGVPDDRIRLLPMTAESTAEEVGAVADYLNKTGGGEVILVTSKYHTRRVSVTWRHMAKNGDTAIVRSAAADRFHASRWWSDSSDAEAVVHEWFGLLNVWTGFPLQPAGRTVPQSR